MQSALIIRDWTVEDLPAVRDVLWRTWTEAYGSFIPQSDMREYLNRVYSDEGLRQMYDDPSVRGTSASEGPLLVGHARSRIVPLEQRCYLSSLYVLPGNQGKGIGIALMRRGALHAAEHGYDRLWIGVMVHNRAGVEWYERYGYTVVEELPFQMGSTSVPHYIGYVPLDRLQRSRA